MNEAEDIHSSQSPGRPKIDLAPAGGGSAGVAEPGAQISLPHLRSLIGLRVRHQGLICVILEVLESPPALVLEPITSKLEIRGPASIMADLHGHPGEYGVESRIVQVLTDDQTGLNDALLELEILDQ